MDIQKFQKFFGSIQKSGGIMITGGDHHVAFSRGRHAAQKAIIQFLSAVAGRAAVKHIARHQKDINIFPLNQISKPVQKSVKFLITLAPIKSAANMPVGGVE